MKSEYKKKINMMDIVNSILFIVVLILTCIESPVLSKGFDANGEKANNKCEYSLNLETIRPVNTH